MVSLKYDGNSPALKIVFLGYSTKQFSTNTITFNSIAEPTFGLKKTKSHVTHRVHNSFQLEHYEC